MREITAKAGQELFIGKRGENNAVCVVFDISEWRALYGAGNVQLIHQRNGDKIPYPCVVEVSGGAALWTITKTDVGNPGVGRAELQYWVGDAIVKSEIFSTKTARSMGDAGENPPEPATTWLEQLQQLGIETEANANAAEVSANDAAASAASVKASEENAAASARSAAASEASVAANAQSAKASADSAANSAATAEAANSETAASKTAAETAAGSANDSANAAAQSASAAKISENSAATSANAAASSAQSASASQQAAASSASASAASASAAAQSATKASASEKNAAQSETAAKAAQAAAEKARDEAGEIVGGDFATKSEAQGYANIAESNANTYTDQKIAAIPKPDVSGEINAHNTSESAHSDIRQAVNSAQSAAQNAAQGYANTAESNANKYTDQKIAAIPTPDVSGQINTHNSSTTAHSDIRQAVSNAASAASAAATAAANAQATANSKEASGTAASAVSAHNSSASAHSDIRTAVSNAASAASAAQSTANTANANATNTDLVKYINGVLKTIGGTAVDAGAKIATGSYVGTGTYGASNPNSLTFSFTPQIVIIYRTERQTPTSTSSSVTRLGYWGAHFAILTRGTTWMAATSGSHDNAATRLTWSENGVSWYTEYTYSGGELTQWNYGNTKYNYIAIG